VRTASAAPEASGASTRSKCCGGNSVPARSTIKQSPPATRNAVLIAAASPTMPMKRIPRMRPRGSRNVPSGASD
jgi:hypothetical protein